MRKLSHSVALIAISLKSNLRIFWLSTIVLVLVTGAAASFLIKVRQSQDKVTQYFQLWEEDLGQTLVLKQNHELLNKISLQLEDLDASVAGSYVKMNSQAANPGRAERVCHFQTDIPMSLSSFPIGQVTVCFKTSALMLESLTSPIFLFTLLLTFLFSSLALHREGKKENALSLANRIADLSRQVAHDVRGPLMALKTLSNHSHELPQEKAQLLQNAIHRIHSIADDLLKKSKNARNSEHPPQKRKLGFCVAQTGLEELMPELRARFPSVSLDLRIDASDPLLIDLSSTEFQRLISNLAQNSVEAMNGREDAAISLSLQSKSGFAFLNIIDNGCGMDEKQVAAALQGQSFGKQNGNGLGLSGASRAVRDHGGELLCNSKPGLGTQISIKLPLASTVSQGSLLDHKS